MHVADFEAGTLAVQTARAQRRQPSFVRQHRQRIGLVHDLRQFAAAEEVFDRRRDALGVDQTARRHVLDVLQAHPFLHGAAQLQEALAQFVAGQFVDRPQAAIAQVVDVVDFGLASPGGKVEQVLDRGDQIFRPQRHFLFGDVQIQLAIDAEAADPAQPIAVDVVELFLEQRDGPFPTAAGCPDAAAGRFAAGPLRGWTVDRRPRR